jgi:integrase
MVQTKTIPLSKEEMDAILLEAEKEDEFDYMFFLTLKTTGRRIGELYGVEDVKITHRKIVGKKRVYIHGKPYKVDRTAPAYKKLGTWSLGVQKKDIDLEKGTMRVWVLKRREQIQDETILSPEVIRLLDKYMRKNRLREEDYVFRKKGRIVRQLQNRLKLYAKRAGIEKPVKIHNFRHYFVTELKRQGWTNDEIIKLTGHKTSSVLAIYDHIVPTDIKEKVMGALKEL